MTNDNRTDGIELPKELQDLMERNEVERPGSAERTAKEWGIPIVTGNRWGIPMGMYFLSYDGLWYPEIDEDWSS